MVEKKNYILQKQLALASHWLQFHMPGKAFQVNITKMSNVKFLPYTLVLHCLPWTLSVSAKLIKLHENSWKGKELDHIEYLYKPLLNINTCNRQVMMSQKLNWLNYGIGWHIQVFLPFIWANWLVHSLGKWYVRFRTGNWISTPNRIYYLYKSLPFSERSETGIKDGFEEMKKKQINIRTTFSDVTFIPEIFCWNDPRSSVPFTLQPDFPETFVNGKQSQKEQEEKCPLSKHQLFGTNW